MNDFLLSFMMLCYYLYTRLDDCNDFSEQYGSGKYILHNYLYRKQHETAKIINILIAKIINMLFA